MRLFLIILLSLLALLTLLFFVWALWPSPSGAFGKENIPLASLDEELNDMMDAIYEFHLESDTEDDLVATLMEFKADSSTRKGVLYIHGFGDYFFHPHLVEWFTDRGINFFAMDLRRYGRSLRPDTDPCFVEDLSEYFEEIGMALETMELEGNDQLAILGHSTGGLVTSLFAATDLGREKVHALILNSPFFQFNYSGAMENMVPVASFIGKMNPRKQLRGPGDPAYSYSIHSDHFGEWDYNKDWKPLEGFPVFAGWINSIYQGHKQVWDGLDLQIPVLVLHSDSTYHYEQGPGYVPAMQRMDAVLNVEHIKKHSATLGSKVDIMTVDDALHDVFLSAPPVREQAFQLMDDWVRKNF